MKKDDNFNKSQKLQSSQINMALGIFMLSFSMIIFISIVFTETTVGKMTNLGAGLVLFLIGGGMYLKAKYHK
jgi:hypothetical protein